MTKRQPRESKAARSENPSWLTTEPVGENPRAPSSARLSRLPLLDLGWENFERLCYRLAKCDGSVEKAWSYGSSGYSQHGIDVLVRLKDGSYEAWQSKRHKKFDVAAVRRALSVFEQAEWASTAKRFVLAIACEVSDPKVIDELELVRDRLKGRGTTFEPLFAPEFSERLRDQPEIIDDFFGRAWVAAICPPEAVMELSDRFSGRDIRILRRRLRDFYTAWIATVDPGLPLVGQSASELPAPALARRYVIPDLLLDATNREPEGMAPEAEQNSLLVVSSPLPPLSEPVVEGQKVRRESTSHASVRRVPISHFLADTERALILADAGTGKTTLLRYLALDILSDEPTMEAVGKKFSGYVPIWVPFALWARISEGKDRPSGLEDVVYAFLDALSAPELADAMRRVLRSGRFVLLVDGLDETSNQEIADTLIVSLSSFAERSRAPLFATSRPHGLKALTGIGGNWSKARLAPLTKSQGDELALLWYRILEAHELGPSVSSRDVERQARVRSSSFTRALTSSPGISRLAQTPLFFLSLLKLYRLGRDLPRNRFDASREIIEQLVDHQPKRRAKDAMKFGSMQKMRQRERVLEDFAYAVHSGKLRGTVADGASDVAAVERATGVIMQRTAGGNSDAAEQDAAAIFTFSEETAGLLVRKTQKDVGFLHRSLQEYFAGAYLAQLPFSARLSFIAEHSGQAIWKEPILNLLYLTSNEQEVGQLVDAVAAANVNDVAEEAVRTDLLTEAVFADFAHDISKVQELAAGLFKEAELYAPDGRQASIVAGTVNGLFSQSVSLQCAAKLSEWLPDYHGWGRAGAISAIKGWRPDAKIDSVEVLCRILTGDVDYLALTAAPVLVEVTANALEIKQKLLDLLKRPRSVKSVHSTMVALGLGWGGDEDVRKIVYEMRNYSNIDIKIDAIRVRCKEGIADLSDLEAWSKIAFDSDRRFTETLLAPETAEYFAIHHKDEFKTKILAMHGTAHGRNSLFFLHSLIIVEPTHPLVEQTLREILTSDFGIERLFFRSGIPLDGVIWTPDLITIIERYIANTDKVYEHLWHSISSVLQLESLKVRMLSAVKSGGYFTFWCSQALRQYWPEDPEVKAAAYAMLASSDKVFSIVAEDVAHLVEDRPAVKRKVIEVLRAKPRTTRHLLAALRCLGVAENDDEAFFASYEAGDLKGIYLDDIHWRNALIKTFPSRPEVRALAISSLHDRDGNIGAIAEIYSDDIDMCSRVLKVLAPLPDATRNVIVEELTAASPSSEVAFELLAEARKDCRGSVAGSAVLNWTDVHVKQDTFGETEVRYLTSELDATGDIYASRRAAAVASLVTAGKLSLFAGHADVNGKLQTIDIAPYDLAGTDRRFLGRILMNWNAVAKELGGEAAALARLEITPARGISNLAFDVPDARKLLRLLEGTPVSHPPQLRDRLAAWHRLDPHGPEMRALLKTILIPNNAGSETRDLDACQMAASLFAEFFAETELLRDVMDEFERNPASIASAAALAELIVRKRNVELEDLVSRRAKGVEYDAITALRLSAALGDVVKALEWHLSEDPDRYSGWECAHWVPAFVRRLNQDEKAISLMAQAVEKAPSESARLSMLVLIGLGGKDKAKTRPILEKALRRYEEEITPMIAFDVNRGSYRVAAHALRELLT